mgnify:FL=1
MNEYKALVIQEGQTETLKTFGNSIEEAIDNLVMMEGVNFLHWIQDLKLQEQWDFDEDLIPLRALRKKIPPHVDISFGVKDDTVH